MKQRVRNANILIAINEEFFYRKFTTRSSISIKYEVIPATVKEYLMLRQIKLFISSGRLDEINAFHIKANGIHSLISCDKLGYVAW